MPNIVSKSLATARELGSLGAFLTLLDERALQSSVEVSEKLANGEHLPLGGFIVAVKDNISVKGVPLTCGSRILGKHLSTFSATAIERLEAAGAVVLAKTNLDEFAMGSSNENSAFGPVSNPFDPSRVPGGSSGGSAVAVSAGICHVSLGSETGGSVRQPASFCGICGLKPTYGRVSRYGLVAFGSSLDQISPFARNCSDLYDVFRVIAGADPRDATTKNTDVPITKELSETKRKLRIGVIRDFVEHDALELEVVSSLRDCISRLTANGHEIIELQLPSLGYSIPVYYIVAPAEASSNLARFDGVRYGYRHPEATDLASVYDLTRECGFGAEVRRRIMLGTYVLSSGFYDSYYMTALRVRAKIAKELSHALQSVDVLLTPTTPTTAFYQGEKLDDPLSMYLSDIFTVPASLAGIPAVSVPWSKDGKGLPIGIQLMANYFCEELLLSTGKLIESIRPKQ